MGVFKLDFIDRILDPSQFLECRQTYWYDLTSGRIRGTGVGRYAAIAGLIALSGMWYRAIHLASLGLAIILAGACACLPRGVGAMVAWLVAGGAWFDTKRVTDGHFPRATAPVAGRGPYERWSGDGGARSGGHPCCNRHKQNAAAGGRRDGRASSRWPPGRASGPSSAAATESSPACGRVCRAAWP